MSRTSAVRVEHIADAPLDRGLFLRVERRHWADGTSCLHITKWGKQPNTGRLAPYKPFQYVQIPWEIRETVRDVLEAAMGEKRWH